MARIRNPRAGPDEMTDASATKAARQGAAPVNPPSDFFRKRRARRKRHALAVPQFRVGLVDQFADLIEPGFIIFKHPLNLVSQT